MAQEAVVHPNDSNDDGEERIVTAVSTDNEAAAVDCSVNVQMSFLPTGGVHASQRRQVRRSVERNASSVLGLAADDDEHVTWRPPTPSTPANETAAEQGSVGSSRWWSWLLYMTARGGHDNNGQKKHVSGECAVLDEVLGVDESLLLSDESQHAQKAPPPAAFQSDYQIMTSNHHTSSALLLHSRHDTTTTTHSTLTKPTNNDNNSLPPDTLLQRCNFFYNGFHLDDANTTTHRNEDALTTTPIWAAYTNHHHPSPPQQQHSTNNDTKSCLETTNGENTLTSLTNRVPIRIPKDNVRLVVMDHRLEPGILSVDYSNHDGALERKRSYHPSDNDHSRKHDNMKQRDMINDDCDEEYKIKSVEKKEDVSLVRCRYCQRCQPYPSRRPSSSSPKPPLNYVLTVEQDLYRRVVKEIADEAFLPMGLYHCCRDNDGTEDHRVSIGVAIWILGIVFGFMLLITLLWPLN